MRRLFALLLALAASRLSLAVAEGPAPQTAEQFTKNLGDQELDFLARTGQDRASLHDRVVCLLHFNCLKLKKDLVVENNQGYFIGRMLVSSDYESGSKVLEEERSIYKDDYPDQHLSRYIGYSLAARRLPSGPIGFASGKYANKHERYVASRILPGGSFGAPGLVAFEFMAADPNEAFIHDNGTARMPVIPGDPNSPQETVRLQPTNYDAGYARSLVVEVPYDQFKKLMAGRVISLSGAVRYYARGGFDREVYDPYDFHHASRQAAYDCQYFTANHKAELDQNVPLARAEAEKICRVAKIVENMESDQDARKVLIRIDKDRSTGRYDALSLEFK